MPFRHLPPIKFQELEKQNIYNLTGGWNDNDNQATLDDSEISDGLNIKLDTESLWTGRGGIQHEGNFLGSTTDILGLHEYYKTSNDTRYDLAVYDTGIKLITSGAWVDQSETLTTGHRAEFCDGNDKTYFTNGYDVVKSFDGSSWADLANFPVNAADETEKPHGLSFFKERIIAWNTDSNPNRVYYSDQGAETIGANNYWDIHEPVKSCIDLSEDFMLTFSENFIYRTDSFFFTGASYSPDKLKQLVVGKGAIAQRSVIKIGNFIYYMSRDGFKRTNGSQEENLSDTKINKFFNTLNQAYMPNAASGTIDDLWYIAVSVDGSINDRVIVYDTLKGIWYPPFKVSTNLNISCFATFVQNSIAKLVGGSDSTGNVFSFENSSVNDHTTDTGYTTSNDADSQIAGATTVRKAQSFQLSENYYVSSIDALLKKVSGTTTELTVRIETDDSGPSGTLADTNATATIDAISSTSYDWKRVTFSTPFVLTASTTYWIVIQHTAEGSGDSIHAWASDDSSPTYTSGSYASYAAGEWTVDTDKDLLFNVNVELGYEKYLITKGYYLGDPQKTKKVRKIFVEAKALGNWNFNVGVNTDLYSTWTEYQVDLAADSPLRGSTLTRGDWTRGATSKVKEFLEPDDVRGRMAKLRYYNANRNENFKVVGTVMNYETINLLR